MAIIFDSGSQGNPALRGRTETLAQAIARGAASVDGTVVKLIPVQEHAHHWDELDEATAIAFGCPTDQSTCPSMGSSLIPEKETLCHNGP